MENFLIAICLNYVKIIFIDLQIANAMHDSVLIERNPDALNLPILFLS